MHKSGAGGPDDPPARVVQPLNELPLGLALRLGLVLGLRVGAELDRARLHVFAPLLAQEKLPLLQRHVVAHAALTSSPQH